VSLFTRRHLRWALVLAGITLAALLLVAYGYGDGDPQQGEVLVPMGESGEGIRSDERTGKSQMATDRSSPIDDEEKALDNGSTNHPADSAPTAAKELQLSDGEKSAVMSATAPTEAKPMTAEEISLFLGLSEVENGTLLVPPTKQPDPKSPTPSATPNP